MASPIKLASLSDTATLILTTMAGYLTELGVTLPDAQYVGAGDIAWDCAALAVYLGTVAPGRVGMAAGMAEYPDITTFTATFHVELVREVSTVGINGIGQIEVPPINVLNDDGLQEVSDAGALVRAAMTMRSNGDLVSRASDMGIGQVLVTGPQGGLVGTSISIEVAVQS